MSAAVIFDNLRQAIADYDASAAEALARQALEQGLDALEVLDIVTEAVRAVGDGFGRGELFLPDLVGAANAMSAAVRVIEGAIEQTALQREAPGTVIVGTVFGDIHSIGKNLVATLLKAEGYRVHDLGLNVRAEAFVDAIQQHNADLLAMSALMTTTAMEQKKVIEALKARGLREGVKVIVGGGGITQRFAESIGADGYEPTAPGAVALARRLLSNAEAPHG
jgi:corrinoid protein of di/trimethylamine methyltransferase